jgi:MarR family transcriptional regulator for hemolysin
VHLVELTEDGEAAFHRMLGTVIAFDRQLRMEIDPSEISVVQDVLQRMRANIAANRTVKPAAVELVLTQADPSAGLG